MLAEGITKAIAADFARLPYRLFVIFHAHRSSRLARLLVSVLLEHDRSAETGGQTLSDDNVIKFRKRQPPPKPKKPLRIPAWLIVVVGALAIGGVSYLMDQGKSAPSTLPRDAGH